MTTTHTLAMSDAMSGGIGYLLLFVIVTGVGLVLYMRMVNRDTSHMTPEEAVNHREKVIKVDKGIAITNVALAVLNQGIKHAGPGPAKKTTASDVAIPAIGLAGYALSRHVERQKDIANGVNPDLPRDQLHAARVAAETARRAAGDHDGFLNALASHGIAFDTAERAVSLASHVCQMARKGLDAGQLVAAIRVVCPDLTVEQALYFMGFALRVYCPEQYTRVTGQDLE